MALKENTFNCFKFSDFFATFKDFNREEKFKHPYEITVSFYIENYYIPDFSHIRVKSEIISGLDGIRIDNIKNKIVKDFNDKIVGLRDELLDVCPSNKVVFIISVKPDNSEPKDEYYFIIDAD